jgi:HK97 gp10 family phage protein
MADTQTLHGLDDVLRKLKALPPELVSRRGGPVGAALRKGANVIRKQWQDNIQRIIDEPNDGGVPTESTGLLKKNVVVRRDSKPWSHGANERYLVRVSNKKYSGRKGRETPSTAQVARLLEYGSEKMTAKPWAKPGFMAARQQALETVVAELNKGIDRAIKKIEQA